jgi:adenylate kinase family enzyme
MASFPYSRIILLGTTSSGKSTLSKRLADLLDLELIELDILHYEPNWKVVPDQVFLAQVKTAIKAERWIVAGSYHVGRDLIWSKADFAVWLDYPLWWILWKLTSRTFTRWWTQELIWETNRENLWVHFKLWSTDSLFHWLLKTYWKRKQEYPTLLALPRYKHINVIRFTHPRETDEWLQTISN